MGKIIIRGPAVLKGALKINGAKNSALAILPAALLAEEPVTIENTPSISDIYIQAEIMEKIGAKVTLGPNNSITVDPSNVKPVMPPYELVKKMRASYYLMGALLAKFGYGKVPVPGGCDLGPRPIDQHIKGFMSLGAAINLEHGVVELKGEKLTGSKVYLDVVSVGATVNTMLAAVKAQGRTIIENCAKEPEIVDLANFLNTIGANVRGAGTDIIKIDGVQVLKGGVYSIIPDRIETGTYMVAAAATGGEVLLKNVIPKHLDPVIAKLRETGTCVEVGEDTLYVKGNGALNAVDVKTLPYPGFPTDLQALIMVLLTQAKGTGVITENVFEGRFRHVDELKRMGAEIKVEGRTAFVKGGASLSGCPIKATDLRAGAACILAGLVAHGVTEVNGLNHIDRGYEKIEDRLACLGVKVERVD